MTQKQPSTSEINFGKTIHNSNQFYANKLMYKELAHKCETCSKTFTTKIH